MTADALTPYVTRTSAAMILAVEYVGPGLTWGRILSTCVISMWSNDIIYKYMFMFPMKNLACKGLSWHSDNKYESIKVEYVTHWNRKVILTTFLSMAPWKLSKWQLILVFPVMRISSKWWYCYQWYWQPLMGIPSKFPMILVTLLIHWGWDKMAAIFQTTFSNAFSLMKMLEFRLRFHWSLFPKVKLRIFQHWFR